jgi:hypothetical protein
MRASPSPNPSSSEPVGNTSPPGVASGSSYRERLLVAVFILFTSLTFFLIQYDRLRTENSGLEDWIRFKLSGNMMAPDQYRIGLSLLLHLLQLHAHLRPNQSLPLIEFLSYAFALMLLYFIFLCSPRVENATDSHRLVLLGFFLATTQFPILWIFPWERSETLPTAFYLAAVVILIVRRSRIPFAIVCLLAALLSLGQALMRAEVPVALGIAILLSAAMDIPFSRPRSHIAVLGLLCVAIGGATQLYLQRIAYPAATYTPGTPRFQLLANLNLLHPPLHIPIFLTALLPLIVSLVLLRRHHLPLDPSDKLVLLILLVYLPTWIAMGIVVEVRIFVPFLFLASPTIAKLWTAYLFNDVNGAQPNPSDLLH